MEFKSNEMTKTLKYTVGETGEEESTHTHRHIEDRTSTAFEKNFN